LGFIFVFLTALSFIYGWYLFAPFFILLRLMMNALDGLLARAQNTASAWGEILNEISDVLGDTISYGVIYWVSGTQYHMIIIFLMMIWFCEFVGILGKSLPGGKRRQESFGGAKPERAVAMGLLSILLYFNPSFEQHYNLFFGILSFFIFITTIKRIHASVKDAKDKAYNSTTEFGR
jgi:CDP-diacylglycerol--glycerol-3-phosphate 3-phosphatidyltransferase